MNDQPYTSDYYLLRDNQLSSDDLKQSRDQAWEAREKVERKQAGLNQFWLETWIRYGCQKGKHPEHITQAQADKIADAYYGR